MTNEKLRMELDSYIKENISKGYSVKAIKDVLIENRLGTAFVDKAIRNYLFKHVLAKPLLVVVLISLVSFLFLLRLPPPVGLGPALPPGVVTVIESYDYRDDITLSFTQQTEYIWELVNKGNLTSVRLSGEVSEQGSAMAYLEHGDESYLIFDSSRLSRESSGVVVYNGDEVDGENKSVRIGMTGGGKRSVSDLFTFDINGEFNWSFESDKVCSLWSVNLEEVECYGSLDCCDFIGLESLGSWNDGFYLNYGRYGNKLENIVSARIIYYDVELEVPYSEIIYSDSAEVNAEFYEEISFEDVCVETCSLPKLEADSYKLLFDIEDASLNVDSIEYTIEEEIMVSGNAPELIKDIENIIIYKNEDAEIDLPSYFYDEGGVQLSYSVNDVDNLSFVISDDFVRIIPDYNFTGKRYVYFVASDGYYDVSSNLFVVDVVEKPLEVSEVEVTEEVIQPRVVINEDVKWIKKVSASDSVINLNVDISSDALGVVVRDVIEDREISSDNLKINDKGVIKDADDYRDEKRVEQIDRIEERLAKRRDELTGKGMIDTEELTEISKEEMELRNEKNKLTGYAVGVGEKGWFTMLFELVSGIEITAYAVADVNETSNLTSVIIEEIIEEIEVEYWTEGPYSEEEDISGGKRVFVSSDIHYEDILAYSYLNDVPESSIKLYRVVNGSRELVDDVIYYDENNNNLIDLIEWIIPSLSNATYEIIYITKAEHLDVNREFIANIYDSVKELDGIWSSVISSGEYVRVTFEQMLDSSKDITIYPRVVSGSPRIEVYEVDGSNKIVEFSSLREGKNTVYLTSLVGQQDMFDLRIVNGQIEIDWIVDPLGPEVEIDYMEYSIDSEIQSAYVSSDSVTSDLTNTRVSAYESSGSASASNAFNDIRDAFNAWGTVETGSCTYTTNQWVAVELVTAKAVNKINIYSEQNTGRRFRQPRYVYLEGSNDGGDGGTWTKISANAWDGSYTFQYNTDEAEVAQMVGYNTFGTIWFDNNIEYKHYRVFVRSNWDPTTDCTNNQIAINEIEMFADILQTYSESGIKQQGSYSLNAFAKQTVSLDDTLTKTFSNVDVTNTGSEIYTTSSGPNPQWAFDNSIAAGGGWGTVEDSCTYTTNQWVAVEFPYARIITEMNIWPPNNLGRLFRNARYIYLEGSDDGIDWTKISANAWDGTYATSYLGDEAQIAQIDNYGDYGTIWFDNNVKYKHYRVFVRENWNPTADCTNNQISINEIEMFENQIDLTDQERIEFDVRASRTGTNLQAQIHDFGGTTSTHDINILASNTWQTEVWDISGVGNSDKDEIDQIIFKVTNADFDNEIYIDNVYAISGEADTIFPGINFTSITPPNDTTTTDTSVEIGINITEANLEEFKFSWDDANYTFYNDSLVLMFNFDNVSSLGEYNSNVKDVSGYGNDGIIINANWTSGKYGGAFEFDGDGDYINLGDFSDLNGVSKFTISTWVKPKNLPFEGFEGIIGIGSDTANLRVPWIFGNSLTSTAYIQFSTVTGGVIDCDLNMNQDLIQDEWNFLTFVWDGSVCSAYMNGEFDSSDPTTGNFLKDSDDVNFMGYINTFDFFNGTIDEVRIWNRSLSKEEVYEHYASNLNKYDTDKWSFYVNQSKNATDGLDVGTYTYSGYAKDVAGNVNSTEERTITILESICGDGVIEGAEECDDGNIFDGDGCNSNCQYETACYFDDFDGPSLSDYWTYSEGGVVQGYGTISNSFYDSKMEYTLDATTLPESETLSQSLANDVKLDGDFDISYNFSGLDTTRYRHDFRINFESGAKIKVVTSADCSLPQPPGCWAERRLKFLFIEIDSTEHLGWELHPDSEGKFRITRQGDNIKFYYNDNLKYDITADAGELSDKASFSIAAMTLKNGDETLTLTGAHEALNIQYGCFNLCGNGITEYGEECDDGNIFDGDGCNSTCQVEVCDDPTLSIDDDLVGYWRLNDDYGYAYDHSGNENVGSVYGNTRLLMHFDDVGGTDLYDSADAYWKFDETAGNAIDETGNGHTGIRNGYQMGLEGEFNLAYSFDGVNNYLDITNPLVYGCDENYTFSMWNYIPAGSPTYWNAFAGGDFGDGGYWMYHEGNKLTYYAILGDYDYLFDTSSMSKDSIPFDEWFHVVIRQEALGGGNVKFKTYINGDEYIEEGDYLYRADRCSITFNRLGAGDFSGGGDRYYTGLMDQVAIWNRALDDGEVLGVYEEGLARDETDYGNDGRINDTSDIKVITSGCPSGSCLEFDGFDDYVEINDDESLNSKNDSFSVEVWFNTQSNKEYQYILDKWQGTDDPKGGYLLFLRNGSLYFSVFDINYPSYYANLGNVNDQNDSNWHHAVGVFDSMANISLYIDGILENTTTNIIADEVRNNLSLIIGSNDGFSDYFNGTIDEVAIYSRALNSSEINESYMAKRPQFVDWGDGKIGGGMEFDGVDDYVELNNHLEDEQGTVCAWIKLNDINKRYHIITGANESDNTRYMGVLRIDGGNNKLSIIQKNNDVIDQVEGGSPLNKNTWYHACTQSDGSQYKLYLNGREESLTVISGTNNGDWFSDVSGVENLIIGTLKRTNQQYFFNGSVDEVSIWNRSLDAAEIAELYGCGYGKYICNATVMTCVTICGDGTLDIGESCDDGNLIDGDGCNSTCQVEVCDESVDLMAEDLVGYWRLNDYYGYAYDHSGNENTGSVYDNTRLLMHFDDVSGTTNAYSDAVAWWKLDEENGDAIDSAGSNNGILSGSITRGEDGEFYKSYEFHRLSKDYVNLGNDANFNFGTEDFTVSTWFKVDEGVNEFYYLILAKRLPGTAGSWYQIVYQNNSKVSFGLHQDSSNYINLYNDKPVNDGRWHHALGSRKNGVAYFYVDGELIDSGASNFDVSSTNDLKIGGYGDATSVQHFDGWIDNVAIWNRALNDGEVLGVYEEGLARDETAYGNDGRWQNDTGGINIVPGVSGSALEFDGVDDYVEVDDDESLSITNELTVMTWVNVKGKTKLDVDGRSCKDILDKDSSALDGTYRIDIDGHGGVPAFDAYCDMTTDGGGWMLGYNKIQYNLAPNYDATLNLGANNYAIPHNTWEQLRDMFSEFLYKEGSDRVSGNYRNKTIYVNTNPLCELEFVPNSRMYLFRTNAMNYIFPTGWFDNVPSPLYRGLFGCVNLAGDFGCERPGFEGAYYRGGMYRDCILQTVNLDAITHQIYVREISLPPIGITKLLSYGLAFNESTATAIINNKTLSTPLSSGWKHTALTYNGTQLGLYIDGILVGTEDYSQNITDTERDFIIGNINGSIDEVAIYSRALNASEINASYMAKRPQFVDWGDGRVGGAMEFDGVDDYVEGEISNLPTTGDGTFAFWVKPQIPSSGAGGRGSTISFENETRGSGGDRYLHIYPIDPLNNNQVTISAAWIGWDYNKTDYSLTPGEWAYIAAVVNQTDVTLYINSNPIWNAARTADATARNYFKIGNRYYNEMPFNGTIDEVSIWNRSLDATEIAELYNGNKGKYICSEGDVSAPGINFTSITPESGEIITDTSVEIGINITKADDLGIFKWNWNGTNYTFYNDSLRLMFNFDNVSGLGDSLTKAVDVSGYGNDGVLYNDVAWVTKGRYGKALVFDGVGDYVNVSNSLSLGVFSVEFWFKPDEDYDSGTSYVSLVYDDDYEIAIKNGDMVFDYIGGSISSTTINSWNKDEWYYILATYDGAVLTLYIKGQYENSAIVSAPFTVQNSNGENVALFLNSGDIVLNGSCNYGVDCLYPVDDSFVIQNLIGETVAYINSTGDLCIEDSDCDYNDANCDNPGDGSFIVKNTADEIVSYINASGDLCLLGGLIQNGNP